jgi:hypothetical protein
MKKSILLLILIILLLVPVEAEDFLKIIPGVTCQNAHVIEESIKFKFKNTIDGKYPTNQVYSGEGNKFTSVQRKYKGFTSFSAYICDGKDLIQYSIDVDVDTVDKANEIARTWAKIIIDELGSPTTSSFMFPYQQLGDTELFYSWILKPRTTANIRVLELANKYNVFWSWNSPNSQQADPSNIKKLLAKFDINKKAIEKLKQELVPRLKEVIPNENWPEFFENIEIESVLISIYQKYFSDAEILSVLAFYETPTGTILLNSSTRDELSKKDTKIIDLFYDTESGKRLVLSKPKITDDLIEAGMRFVYIKYPVD